MLRKRCLAGKSGDVSESRWQCDRGTGTGTSEWHVDILIPLRDSLRGITIYYWYQVVLVPDDYFTGEHR